ncbi:hypothetical protein LNQ51_16135 [Yersinia ruckeri]|uniref:hypothetical protein n=1 Tax=Yersinia ruckeri TaxID=29486 RepID=UPI0020BDF8D0|nr:hypothetical protein [Yersinia ruckeri]MCK8586380.1 hypothetical protein [Yersinia ruckeri]
MTLDSLKGYLEIDTPLYTQQRGHIAALNAARADFGISLKEIRFEPVGGMLLRRYSPPPGHTDKVAWEHIKSQIQEWVVLIESHQERNFVSLPQRCLKWARKPFNSIISSLIVAVILDWVNR